MSEIPPNQRPVLSQSGMNGDGPPQYQTLVGRSPTNPASTAVQEGMTMTPEMLASEFARMPPPSLAQLKQDLGIPDKDLAIMSPEEKTKLVQLFREGTTNPRNAPGPSNTGMAPGQQLLELPGGFAPRTPSPNTSGSGMTAPSPSAILTSTPTMSNHPPPPPPPGQNPNPPDLDPNMFSLNFTEFTDLDPAALMGEGVDFERDFAAWFNPGPHNAGGP